MVKKFNDYWKIIKLFYICCIFANNLLKKKSENNWKNDCINESFRNPNKIFLPKEVDKICHQSKVIMSKKIKNRKTRTNPIIKHSLKKMSSVNLYKMSVKKTNVAMKSLRLRFMEENSDFKCWVKSIYILIGFRKPIKWDFILKLKKKTFSETIFTL